MNARADKPAELIARYLDSILRRGSKAAAQEGSLEDVLDAALALFRYVQVGPASLPLHRAALRLSCGNVTSCHWALRFQHGALGVCHWRCTKHDILF